MAEWGVLVVRVAVGRGSTVDRDLQTCITGCPDRAGTTNDLGKIDMNAIDGVLGNHCRGVDSRVFHGITSRINNMDTAN